MKNQNAKLGNNTTLNIAIFSRMDDWSSENAIQTIKLEDDPEYSTVYIYKSATALYKDTLKNLQNIDFSEEYGDDSWFDYIPDDMECACQALYFLSLLRDLTVAYNEYFKQILKEMQSMLKTYFEHYDEEDENCMFYLSMYESLKKDEVFITDGTTKYLDSELYNQKTTKC